MVTTYDFLHLPPPSDSLAFYLHKPYTNIPSNGLGIHNAHWIHTENAVQNPTVHLSKSLLTPPLSVTLVFVHCRLKSRSRPKG